MLQPRLRCIVLGLLTLPLFGALSCRDKDEKERTDEAMETAAVTAQPTASAKKKPERPDPKALADRRKALKERLEKKKQEGKPVAKVPVAEGDPENGDFTLEEGTANLPTEGALVADIQTDLGTLSCELYEDKAPITVATFVGLARGLRAWKKDDKWVKKALYDGTTFHRIIKGFMIQGGDPAGNGTGGPGFVIPDEIWANAKHDKRGLLCMANRGPNTNGSQFFILDGAAPHLDGGYTIFGACTPDDVIQKLATTEVKGDRAVKPPKIRKVVIKRDKSKPRRGASPAASATAAPAGSAPSAGKAAPPPPTSRPTPSAPAATPKAPTTATP